MTNQEAALLHATTHAPVGGAFWFVDMIVGDCPETIGPFDYQLAKIMFESLIECACVSDMQLRAVEDKRRGPSGSPTGTR